MAIDDAETAEQKPIDVETEVTDTGAWAKSLGVTVPAETVTKEFNAVLGEFAGLAQLPGFRPGKVPRHLVEKRFGDEVRKQATANLVRRALHSAILKSKLDVIGEPKLEGEGAKLRAEKGQPFAFKVQVEVKPAFELSHYKGLTVEQEEVEVLPEDMDEALERVRQRHMESKAAPPEHGLGEGDVALAELGFVVDGAEVHKEGGAVLLTEGRVAGAHAALEAKFLEGAKAGEKRRATGKLDERFPVAEHRGKNAEIEIGVQSIKLRSLPPVDDALAQKVGLRTLDELKQKLRASLVEGLSEETRRKTQYELLDRIVATTPFDLPDRLRDTMQHQSSKRSLQYLAQLGIDTEALGENRAKFEANAKERAVTEMRRYFVIDAICAKESLTVTDQDVDEEIVRRARANNMRASELYDRMRDSGELSQLESELKVRKALDFLIEQADVKIVPRKPRAKPQDHQPAEHCQHARPAGAEAPAAGEQAPSSAAAASSAGEQAAGSTAASAAGEQAAGSSAASAAGEPAPSGEAPVTGDK